MMASRHHLKPASETALAREVISLIGDQDKLMQRVEKLLAEGDIRVATHLAEWICLAGADNAAAQTWPKRVYLERSRQGNLGHGPGRLFGRGE